MAKIAIVMGSDSDLPVDIRIIAATHRNLTQMVEHGKFRADLYFRLAVVLDLMAYLLTPEAQAYTYDEGYFYPGPAVKDVPLSMAPKESQDAIKEFGRPEYETMIAGAPLETPLDAKGQVAAFKKWDQEIGGAKVKK